MCAVRVVQTEEKKRMIGCASTDDGDEAKRESLLKMLRLSGDDVWWFPEASLDILIWDL